MGALQYMFEVPKEYETRDVSAGEKIQLPYVLFPLRPCHSSSNQISLPRLLTQIEQFSSQPRKTTHPPVLRLLRLLLIAVRQGLRDTRTTRRFR